MHNILVFYKKSTFELRTNSPDESVRHYMAQNNQDVQRQRQSHKAQQESLDIVLKALSPYHTTLMCRGDCTSTEGYDLVVSVGGDGTMLDISHYIEDIPLLGVNSDPKNSVGFYSLCHANKFRWNLNNFDTIPKTTLNRAKIDRNGTQIKELALNDILLAHANPAETTRYTTKINGITQRAKNSGLLISTAAGSTAFIHNEGGIVMPLDSTQFQYHGRSLRGSGFHFAEMVEVTSQTREGKILIDGGHVQYKFTLGDVVRVTQGNPIIIVGDLNSKRIPQRLQ